MLKIEKINEQEVKIAIVRAKDLPIGLRHSVAICKFIKGRKINEAIKLLEDVGKKRIAVPMRGELPHRKNMMSGRYPIKAAYEFIKILKSLSANTTKKNLDIDKIKIHAKADTASRPPRGGRFKRKFKRTNVTIEVK